jgi:hypothetical protein
LRAAFLDGGQMSKVKQGRFREVLVIEKGFRVLDGGVLLLADVVLLADMVVPIDALG